MRKGNTSPTGSVITEMPACSIESYFVTSAFLPHRVRYPPYESSKTKLAKFLLRNPAVPDLSLVKYGIVFLLGLFSIYLIRTLAQVGLKSLFRGLRSIKGEGNAM